MPASLSPLRKALGASVRKQSPRRSPATYRAWPPSAGWIKLSSLLPSRSCRSRRSRRLITRITARRPNAGSQPATPTTGRRLRSRSSSTCRSGRKIRTSVTPASRSSRPATCSMRYGTPANRSRCLRNQCSFAFSRQSGAGRRGAGYPCWRRRHISRSSRDWAARHPLVHGDASSTRSRREPSRARGRGRTTSTAWHRRTLRADEAAGCGAAGDRLDLDLGDATARAGSPRRHEPGRYNFAPYSSSAFSSFPPQTEE